jgi:hypothetical protein
LTCKFVKNVEFTLKLFAIELKKPERWNKLIFDQDLNEE